MEPRLHLIFQLICFISLHYYPLGSIEGKNISLGAQASHYPILIRIV